MAETGDSLPELLTVRLPAGSVERIRAVLREGEDRAAFLRQLIAAEVELREIEAKRQLRVAAVETLIAPLRSTRQDFGVS